MARMTKEQKARVAQFDAERAAERAAEEARMEQRRADRLARVANRGTPEQFSADRSVEDEMRLRWMVRWALGTVEAVEQAKAKFDESFAANPASAMEWSGSLAQAAAEASVGRDVLGMFAAGMSEAEVMEQVQKQVVNFASNGGSNSTSAASNMMRDLTMAAWAKLVTRYYG